MLAASRVYNNSGILPAIMPEEAKTDSVVFVPGTYAKGTVLGQFNTLTNAADLQTITITGGPTGGSFRLSFYNQVTAPIAFNANAAAVQAAMEALSSVGAGNVVGGGGALPGTPVTLTFQGDLANRWMPAILVYSNSLTGGAAPAVAIAHTTPGRSAAGAFAPYNDANADGTQVAKCIVEFDTEVDPFGNHRAGGGEWGQGTQKSAPVWIKGVFKTNELTGLDAAAVADLGRIMRGDVANLANSATLLWIG
jgi:hypothetical protein